MSNSGAPIGENGRKELKVVESNQVEELLEKYFADLNKEGYGKIDIRAMAFDVPEVSLRVKGVDDSEKDAGIGSSINVLSSKGIEVKLEELLNAIAKPIKLADLKKVKAKVDKIKAEKRQARTEKPDDKDER